MPERAGGIDYWRRRNTCAHAETGEIARASRKTPEPDYMKQGEGKINSSEIPACKKRAAVNPNPDLEISKKLAREEPNKGTEV